MKGRCKFIIEKETKPELYSMLYCIANIPHIYKFFLIGDDLNHVDYKSCFGATAHSFADYIRVFWNRTERKIKIDFLDKEFANGFELINRLEDSFIDEIFKQFYQKIYISKSYLNENDLTVDNLIDHTLSFYNIAPNIIIALDDAVKLKSIVFKATHRLIGLVAKKNNTCEY